MKFYVLNRHPQAPETEFECQFWEEDDEEVVGEAPACEVCGSYVGPLPWMPPFRAGIEYCGRDYADVVFGPGDNLLVSERFKALWEEAGMIGLESFDPVEIVRIKKMGRGPRPGPVPKYFRAHVMRMRVAVDDERSGIDRLHPEQFCRSCAASGPKRARRIVVDADTWAGEDVCFPRNLAGVIVTSERFASWCQEHAMRNVVLVPADEFSFDHYPNEPDADPI